MVKFNGVPNRSFSLTFLSIARVIPAFAMAVASLLTALYAQPTKFDFGTGTPAPGYTKVTPTTVYSSSQGYGFEQNKSPITAVTRTGSDVFADYCTSSDSFSFSVGLPLGNYTVTVYLGDLSGTSSTSVSGEQRRLFLDRTTTASGQTSTQKFTINRRDYKNGSTTIGRTDRELTYMDFDDRLNFRFAGSKIAVCGMDVVKADASVITVYVCGNSTSVDQPAEPFMSWPQMITLMFNEKVSIADYAESGLTASSFIGQRRLDMVGTVVKAGDYVLAEFGHNDQKNPTDIANYCSNLTKYSALAKSKNATPLYVTPTARKTENDPATSVGGMAQKARDCAKTNSVKIIELNSGVIALHQSIGSANVAALYATGDGTHFSDYGSLELARVVAKEIVGLNLDIAADLRPGYTNFDPSKPDPLNYLSGPGTITAAQGPSEVRKTLSNDCGLSVNPGAQVLRFNPGRAGEAVFSVYSLNGNRIAEKRCIITQTQGSLAWRELGALPVGIYVIGMSVESDVIGKTMMCKL